MNTLFITGTDTNIGKTFITKLLLEKFNELQYKTFGIKPIASGCEYNANGELRNEDALILQNASSMKQAYQVVNPIALPEPIAPHIAAVNFKQSLTKKIVEAAILKSIQPQADINLVEGVGGWAVPLNDHELLSEIISSLKMPVILVVGMKLGCLNHAILTYHHIMQMKAPFIGWIANCLEPNMLKLNENIQTLKQWIKQPCLSVVSHNSQSMDIDIEYIKRLLF